MHQAGITEVFDKIILSLNSCESDATNFRGIELFPLLFVEFDVKRHDGEDRNKIDKSVTDITLILTKN